MGKITFRADDEIIEALEELDVSKSEALREASRNYLEESDSLYLDSKDLEDTVVYALGVVSGGKFGKRIACYAGDRVLERNPEYGEFLAELTVELEDYGVW